MPSPYSPPLILAAAATLLALVVAAAAAATSPAAAAAPAPATRPRAAAPPPPPPPPQPPQFRNFSFTIPPRLRQQEQQQQPQQRPQRKVTLRATVGRRAVDGVERDVVMVNGKFQPPIIVNQGDQVELEIINALPRSWPQADGGIIIHQHGWSMADRQAAWHDGAAGVGACVVPPEGGARRAKFVVREPPGLYFYHDHSSLVRGDGLMGPLIVRPPAWAPEDLPLAMIPGAGFGGDDQTLFPTRGGSGGGKGGGKGLPEHVLFMTDWWHFSADAMALRFNRPFDPSKQKEGDDPTATGKWHWIGLPKAILINGQGSYAACEDVTTRELGQPMRTGALATVDDLLLPDGVAGQLRPAAAFPTCNATGLLTPAEASENGASTRRRRRGFGAPAVIDVPSGQTTLLRLVNAASLVYLTFCARAHWLRVVAADAVPVRPWDAFECVDLNAGQRLDVLLVANATGASVGSTFWLSASPQYRKGAPTGYAVLRYVDAAASAAAAASASDAASAAAAAAAPPASAPPASAPLLATLPPQDQMIQPAEAAAKAKSLDTLLRIHPLLLAPTSADYAPAASRVSLLQDRRRLDLAVQAVRSAGNEAPRWDSDEGKRYGPSSSSSSSASASAASAASSAQAYSPPQEVSRRFVLRTTQPLFESNGFIRWALNNVAMASTPDCPPLMQALYDDATARKASSSSSTSSSSSPSSTSYLLGHRMDTSLTRSQLAALPGGGAYFAGAANGSTTYGPASSEGVAVFDGGQDDEVLIRSQTPRAGMHVLSLPELGEAVEIVLQNERAGAHGGEYGEQDPSKNPAAGLVANRTGIEQHPMHIHGYHVFVVGQGEGRWTLADPENYNTKDPPLRDTVTVLATAPGTAGAGGWTAIRFRTSNVGVWPLR
jgi:FtsP/CotA-like multicopper oxidase with cupredoxin domain